MRCRRLCRPARDLGVKFVRDIGKVMRQYASLCMVPFTGTAPAGSEHADAFRLVSAKRCAHRCKHFIPISHLSPGYLKIGRASCRERVF